MRITCWWPRRRLRALLCVTALLFVALPNLAQAGVQACIEAHSQAQVLRDGGQLKASREAFQGCLASDCPGAIRQECAALLDDVQNRLPTVVPVARTATGEDLPNVSVSIDSGPFRQLDGLAIEVDPGRHQYRFVAQDGRQQVVEALALESLQAQRVSAVFDAALPTATPDAPVERAGPSRTVPLILGAVGIAGLAGFAVLAASGRAQENSLRDTCAPNCEESDRDEVASKYLWADVSLAVGALSLAGGAYLYFVPPSSATPAEVTGVVGGWRGRF